MVDNFYEFEKFVNQSDEKLVNVIDPWDLYYAQKNKDKCTNCNRKIIDNMKTKNGCIWCDSDYHKKRIKNGQK